MLNITVAAVIPPHIIHTFISQNQSSDTTADYTRTQYSVTVLCSLKCYFSMAIFKCHIAEIHQYRLYHLVHTYNHCKS